MQNRKDQMISKMPLSKWEEYNNDDGRPLYYFRQAIYELPKTYTHFLFNSFSLMSFTKLKRWLQFGAASGEFLYDRKVDQCEVLGYDHSTVAIRQLLNKNIPARKMDLNSIKADDIDNLISDLAQPCNMVLIRLIEYIKDDALILLLHLLIEKSQPGSVFYLSNNVDRELCEESSDFDSSYIKSFFAVRTDIQFLFFARSLDKNNKDKILENLGPKVSTSRESGADDHIMVFKKVSK